MFAPGVKFKLTLDMCNSLLFYMHNYVKFIFSRLSVEERYLPKNYYLLLYNNIFENRTEQTIQNLYTILNNYILEKHSDASSCNYHLTQVRCVCLQKLGYVQEGTSDICLKSVKDPEKVREHTMDLFSYLLSYKQLYRLKYGDGYDAYLQERLSKLRNFMFDSVFIGFDELFDNSATLKSIKNMGYFNLSDFMRDLYASLTQCTISSELIKFYCFHLSSYNLVPDLIIVGKSTFSYRYPYNLLLSLFPTGLSSVLPIYFKLRGTELESLLGDYLFKCLTQRERKVLLYRFKEGKTLVEVGTDFLIDKNRVRQIELKALGKLHSYAFKHKLGNVNVLYSALVEWQKEDHSKSMSDSYESVDWHKW